MIIDSKYTKAFKSNNLTHLKYDELLGLARLVREHRNAVSAHVNQHLLQYLDYSKFQFLKEMRAMFNGSISSSFDAQLYTDVYTAYQNKFTAIQQKLKFETVTFQGFELYKRDNKKHKKGDLKRVVNEHKATPLSTCLTYLVRYGNEDTVSYIATKLTEVDENKRRFYENILNCCTKFGFARLYSLALRKRTRVIKHYSGHPIEFKSLTFSGRCRKSKIVDYNKHFGSVINSFISLSGFSKKSFDIPVKYSKNYHGNMKDYAKPSNDYEYTLTFDEKHKQVNVHLCKDGKRYIPQAGDNIIGIDVNCKHNLFSLSNRTTYDYDRKLVNDYCKLATTTDILKKDKSYVVGKRRQRKLDTLKMKMVKSEQQLIANICKTLREQGANHLVMENLDNGFGKCYVKDSTNEDINYNRKVKFLGISSLKNEFEHISRKYDIAVSTVHASYTSKMCPICGCIEDENRQTQETFECIECGYKDNADFNAAINIRNRVCEAVLRNALLKQLDNGAFEPKNLKREKVKDVLLSFRRNLQKTVGSECGESGLTTFDYV
jgi:transposase